MADEEPRTNEPMPDEPAPDEPTSGERRGDLTERALDGVEDAADSVRSAAEQVIADGPVSLPELGNGERTSAAVAAATGMKLLDDVDLRVTIELGRTRMYVEDVLRLNAESVIELDKAAGDHVDIYVNDRLVARGEVLVLNENFCVRVSEIVNARSLDATTE
jgi:flagellar motor switch protein FliN/FliY